MALYSDYTMRSIKSVHKIHVLGAYQFAQELPEFA